MNDPAKEPSTETAQVQTTSDIRELLGERNVLSSVRVKTLLIMGGMMLVGLRPIHARVVLRRNA